MSSTEQPDIVLDGHRYFLASKAAADFGFTPHHIARLARQGKIDSRRIGKKWYVEPESLRAYLKMLGELSRPANLSSEAPERTSAERIAHAMHAYGRHTMRDWSPPTEVSERRGSVFPLFPLASLALAIILFTAATFAAFNPTGASTIMSRVQSQFAAASADTSIFDRAAQFLFRAVCPIFRSCDLNDARIADSQNSGGTDQNFIATPQPRQAATTASTPSTSSGQGSSQTSPEATSGTAPQAASNSFASASPISTAGNPPVVQRVIERIVERALPTYTIAQGGITEAILNDRLNQLDKKLSSQIFSLSASLTSVPNSLPASGGVTNNVALTQRIDNLDRTTITNPTITGASISGGTVIATSLSGILGVGSGGTGTSTAPSYGQMFVGNGSGGYSLLATSSLGISTGGTPGGSDTYVQFNNNAVFGGVSSFTFASSTGLLTVPYASTTAFTVSGTASTSLFFANGLSNCNSNNNLTWLDGTFGCEADDTTVGTANTFAWEQNYATVNAATSSIFWAKSGLNASSTSHFANASTTEFTTGTQWFAGLANSGLGVDANGKVYAAATSTLSTISGTLALTQLANQNANTVLANLTGGNAAPTAISTTTLFAGSNGQVLAFANGAWTGVATTTFSSGLTYAGGAVTCDTASASALGCLSSADWTTFNNKQAAGNYITALTGDVTASGPGSASVSFALGNAHWWTARQNFGYASTSQFTATSSVWFTSLGTPAGTLLAVDPNGLVIATTTPAVGGSGTVTNIATTYPITGGPITTTGTLSLAFGTTTTNTWTHQIFSSLFATNASSTNATTTNLHITGLTNSGLGVDANGKVYAAATSTLSTISGTLALTQLANQNANTVLANATAGSAAPTAIATSSFFGAGVPGGYVLASNGSTWAPMATATCLQITGSAGLCDGDDATGGGGSDPFTHPTATQSATTSLLLFNAGASSTKFSAYEAWFGGTATSTFTSAGFLGIGTTSPWGMLSINPNGITGPSFVVGSSTATSFIVTNGGNVGIGSTSPATLLAVAGTSTFRDIVPEGPYTENLSLFSIGDSSRRWNKVWAGTLNIGTSTFSLKSDSASSLGFFTAANGGGTQVFTLTSNGYVGIGTSTPAASLTIQAATNVVPLKIASSSGATLLQVNTDGSLDAKLKQLTADYVVDAGSASISVGDIVSYINGKAQKTTSGAIVGTPVAANAVSSTDTSVAALDSTHFVVAYVGASNYANAVVYTVSGTTITPGTPVALNNVSSSDISVAALNSTHFVVAYVGASSYANAVVSTVSGTTITPGTPVVVYNAASNYTSVAALDSTYFVVAYRRVSSGYARAVVSTVSGTTITPGNSVDLNNVSSSNISAAALNSTHFVVTYGGASSYANAVVSTVSGTSITPGTPVALNNVSSSYISVAALNSTHFVVAYGDTSNDVYAVVGTVSGTTITSGYPVALNSVSSSDISVAALDSTHFVVGYSGALGHAHAVVSTVSGVSIMEGYPVALNNVSSSYISVAALDSTHFVVAYRNESTSYANAVASSFEGRDALGMATNAASPGGTVTVASNGIVSGLSGLSAGGVYYVASDGSATTTSTFQRIGFAISSTQMLLNSGPDAAPDEYYGDMIFANNFKITEGWEYPNSLIWKNQLGREIFRLDETGAFSLPGMLRPVTAAFFNALMATTSAEELIASSAPDSSAPWRGSFAAASDALKDALSSLGAAVVRVFVEPIYAAIGIFEKVFAKEFLADTRICIGATCITESQLAAVLAATDQTPESLPGPDPAVQLPTTTTPALPLSDATTTDSTGSTLSTSSTSSPQAGSRQAGSPQAAATYSPPLAPEVLPTGTDASLLVPEQEPEPDAPMTPDTTIPTDSNQSTVVADAPAAFSQ